MGNILNRIKEEAKKSGTSKGKFLMFKEDEKKRVRFLTEVDDGLEVIFHDSYSEGINVPCQEIYGRDCSHCEDKDLRTRPLFCWSVYDYDTKEVKILMQAVNNCTAVAGLAALDATFGTLLDRDIIITKTGKGQGTQFTSIALDKNKFKNTKAKAFSESAILKYLDKAYPDPDGEDIEEDEDEDEKPARNKKTVNSGKSSKNKKEEPEEDEWEDEEPEDEYDYDEMSDRELYNLCKERKIDVLPRKPEKYYIKKLKEYDEARDEWEE